jgi:hypothetical protein
MKQASRHETAGEGTMVGLVYRKEICYTGPKTFQNDVSQYHRYKQLKEAGSVLHKKGA